MPLNYESVKIYDEDYRRAEEIRGERGVTIVEAIGAALEGWKKLPKAQQDRIIRDRVRRRDAERDAA